MQISKLDGIKLLNKLGLPTVKLLNVSEILSGQTPIDEGISIRLSPKNKSKKWNVGLPSIHKRKNIEEIKEFIDENSKENLVFAHKTVNPDIIGSISRLENEVVIESYKDYEQRYDEIINNSVTIPVIGERLIVSRLKMLNENQQDFEEFKKVIMYLTKIPYNRYDMEYVIENGNVIFMDFTVADFKECSRYEKLPEER